MTRSSIALQQNFLPFLGSAIYFIEAFFTQAATQQLSFWCDCGVDAVAGSCSHFAWYRPAYLKVHPKLGPSIRPARYLGIFPALPHIEQVPGLAGLPHLSATPAIAVRIQIPF